MYERVVAASERRKFPGRLLSEIAGSAIQRITPRQHHDYFGSSRPVSNVRLSSWNDTEKLRGVRLQHFPTTDRGQEVCLDLDLCVFVFRKPHALWAAMHETEARHLNPRSGAWFPDRESGRFFSHPLSDNPTQEFDRRIGLDFGT